MAENPDVEVTITALVPAAATLAAMQLRVAATAMRDQRGPGHPRHDFWHALALWLDAEAATLAREVDSDGIHRHVSTYHAGCGVSFADGPAGRCLCFDHPQVIARAYLGATSDE